MTKWRDDPRRAALLAIYREVDRLLSPYSCDSSTECCRFGLTGREPYPTAVELEEMMHAIKALGGVPALRKRSLPLASERERPCPLLSAEGRCRIYAARPFGCRTFFCERVTGPDARLGKLPRSEIQRLSRAVADLSARFAPRDPAARPLTSALARLAGDEPGGRRSTARG